MATTTVHEIQALIRGRRKDLMRTQEDVAGAAGVSRKWLSDFERGATTAIELPLLLRVLAALQLEIEIAPRSADQRDPTENDVETVDLDVLLAHYRESGDGR